MIDSISRNTEPRSRELSAGLLRQRRNLLLMSLLMPIFFISNAAVEEINMFGTVITVNDQSGIKFAIFSLFVYFLLRYYQYYGEEQHVVEMKGQRLSVVYEFEFNHFLDLTRVRATCFDVEHLYMSFVSPVRNEYASKVIPKMLGDKKISLLVRSREIEIYGLDRKYEELGSSGESSTQVEIFDRNEIRKNWTYVNKEQRDNRSEPIFKTYIEYNIACLFLLRLWGNVKFLVKQSYFTDYQLPFILAASSLIFTVLHII